MNGTISFLPRESNHGPTLIVGDRYLRRSRIYSKGSVRCEHEYTYYSGNTTTHNCCQPTGPNCAVPMVAIRPQLGNIRMCMVTPWLDEYSGVTQDMPCAKAASGMNGLLPRRMMSPEPSSSSSLDKGDNARRVSSTHRSQNSNLASRFQILSA